MHTKIIYKIMHAYLMCFLKNKNGVVFVNLVNIVHYWKSHQSIDCYYLDWDSIGYRCHRRLSAGF